ncbi:hypothetical protein BpHYR1_028226 [Brachionus plicatilis]|uniref:Uncharacterized protein n=1 Tax=Brachionus plicatilis TaxID=10195 RepID=A0A3M7R6F9_BRAPC|nr:hypothetical protein BpHYR1_028226 [Brachionus plicatilis]
MIRILFNIKKKCIRLVESKVQNGEINMNFCELKIEQDGISRYYCRFMGHGRSAALVLELIDENRCNFKESEETHSKHPDQHRNIFNDIYLI